jgi:hypothetical protein
MALPSPKQNAPTKNGWRVEQIGSGLGQLSNTLNRLPGMNGAMLPPL